MTYLCLCSHDIPLHISSNAVEWRVLPYGTTPHTRGETMSYKFEKHYSFVLTISQYGVLMLIAISLNAGKPMTRELEHRKNASFRTHHRDCHWMVRWQKYTQNHIIICDFGYIFHIYISAALILERLFYNASHRLYVNSVGWLWRSLLKNELITSKGRDPSRSFLMFTNSHWILMVCQPCTQRVS